jgi:hypothetical protein
MVSGFWSVMARGWDLLLLLVETDGIFVVA